MRAGLLAATTLLWLLHAPRAALADQQPARNAISHEPFAILSRGFVVQFERLVLPDVSVIGGVGARFAARDDFTSQTWLGKLEGRYWLSDRPGMVGSFAAFGATAARTAVENRRMGRDLGALWQLEETLRIGYRFVAFGFQEITPSSGIDVIHEFDERGRLAPITYVTLGVNLTVGWMF